jgi:hypothetical protein
MEKAMMMLRLGLKIKDRDLAIRVCKYMMEDLKK